MPLFPSSSGDSAFSGARITKTSNQTLTTGIWPNVSWDAEIYDVGGWWTAGTPTRITVPASANGAYVNVVGNAEFDINAAGGRWCIIQHYDSSNNILRIASASAIGVATVSVRLNAVLGPVQVATGDYFLFVVRQDSGGNLDLLGAASEVYATSFGVSVIGY